MFIYGDGSRYAYSDYSYSLIKGQRVCGEVYKTIYDLLINFW